MITFMEFIFNFVSYFDCHQFVLLEWFTKLEQRFNLSELHTNYKKIKLFQIYIGQAGEDILSQLPDNVTWAEVKATLLSQFGGGTQEEEAWNALKRLTCSNAKHIPDRKPPLNDRL